MPSAVWLIRAAECGAATVLTSDPPTSLIEAARPWFLMGRPFQIALKVLILLGA